MAVQGFFFRASTLINNGRFLLNNRLPQFAQTSGIKHKAEDLLRELKVPEKPKRPLTPYFRFAQDRRASIIRENPNWKITQVAVKCSTDWKSLDPSSKAKYETAYKTEMEEYALQFLKYTKSLTDKQKQALSQYNKEIKESRVKREHRKKLRDHDKPKRPAGAYMLYVMEQTKLHPGKTYAQLLSLLKKNWADLPAAEKIKFSEAATKAQHQYAEDLKKWELKMIETGNLDLVRQGTLMGKSPKPGKKE